jgi:hypothetical protein
MRADAERYYAGNAGIATLYLGVFLPPAAWFLHLVASFTLAAQLCSGRHEWVLHAVGVAALLVVVAGGLLAWRNWKGTGRRLNEDRGGTIARSNFLAVAGLASTAFFGLVILASEVPNWFLPPCLYG